MDAKRVVEIVLNEKKRPKAKDLLQAHDAAFIRNLYQSILGREPDLAGFTYFLEHLRSGRRTKMEIIFNIASSKEAKAKGVKVEGIHWGHRVLFTLYKFPIFGDFVRWLHYHLDISRYIRRLHALENSALGGLEELRHELERIKKEQAEIERNKSAIVALGAEVERLKKENADLHKSLERSEELFSFLAGRLSEDATKEKIEKTLDERFYLKLEERFRGDPTQGLRRYLGFVKAPVLDIGCGRGEWLRLLQKESIEAVGVDMNETFVKELQKEGLQAMHAEALEFLKRQPSGSFATVSAFHFIEHLPISTLLEFLAQVHRVLMPGGVFIAETPNPKNLGVGACNFYIDPTHIRPIPPQLGSFLCEYVGFEDVRIVGEPYEMKVEGALQEFVKEWVAQPEDYAIVAQKRKPTEKVAV